MLSLAYYKRAWFTRGKNYPLYKTGFLAAKVNRLLYIQRRNILQSTKALSRKWGLKGQVVVVVKQYFVILVSVRLTILQVLVRGGRA